MGGALSAALRAGWVPKITNGWFFRAETFFSVARYLDEVSDRPPDFLSYSHGEGFLRFFEERCQKQGIFIFDEPESALSPARQMEFLKLLHRMDSSRNCQVIMATHSPMLMAYPQRAVVAVDQVRPRARDGGGDRSLPGDARILQRSARICGGDAGGVNASSRRICFEFSKFWLDLQGQYDIGVVEREKGAEIARRVRPADAA